MPQLKRNVFPDDTVILVGMSSMHQETVTIQNAIDKLAAKGGGHVVIPAGIWHTGRLILKSNIDLHLNKGAYLHFSGNVKDYLPVVLTRNEGVDIFSLGAMIYANGADNIGLTGEGHLVAPKRDCEIYKRHFVGDNEDFFSVPLKKRIFDGKNGTKVFMPEFFGPINCTNVLVEGVTFDKSIFWNICPTYCKNVIIRGVTVRSTGLGRTDGIDIDSSVNTLVEYCTLDCGDDCFTMKAGRGRDGFVRNRPTENVVIRHCKTLHGAGCITIGSETAGMVRNVYVYDCEADSTTRGFYIKSRRTRGGGGENCWFENIRLRNIRTAAFCWDMLGSSRYMGNLAHRYPVRKVDELTPVFRNMHFKDIRVESCDMLITATGLPERPITDVTMENIISANKEIKLQDVDSTSFKIDLK